MRLAAFVVCAGFAALPDGSVAQQAGLTLERGSIQFEGSTFEYRIGGEGPAVMFIHGGSRSWRDWEPFLAPLARHATVVLVDLPGHVDSDPLPTGFSLAAAARAYLNILDELAIDQVRGVGHSLGASTWLQMAAQQPWRVTAMVLIAGNHRMPGYARDYLAGLTVDDATPEQWAYFLEHHPGGEEQIRAIYRDVRSLATNYDDFEFSLERLATIPTRTLILAGDRDPLVPVELGLELYQAMPNAQLNVMPNQGHMPLWPDFGGSAEIRDGFAQALLEFFGLSESN